MRFPGSPWLAVPLLVSSCAAPRWRDDVADIERLARIDLDGDELRSTRADLPPHAGVLAESEAVVRATEQHPRIDALLLELGVSRGQVMTAGALPPITFEAEYLPRPDADIALLAEFEVLDAILAPIRGRAAQAEHAARVREVASTVLEIGFETRVTYHAAQAAQLRLDVAERTLDAFEAGAEAARALFEAGNISLLERSAHELAAAQAREAAATAASDAAAARIRLALRVGLDAHDPSWSIVECFDPVGGDDVIREDLVAASLDASLLLQADRFRIEGLGRSARLARVDARVPDFALGAVGEFSGDADASDEPWRFGALAVLEIPLPGSRRGAVISSDAAYAATQSSHLADAMALRAAAATVLENLRSTTEAATTCLEQSLPSARAVREQTLLHYNAMQVGVFDLLAALRAELATESRCIDLQQAYWDARAAQYALLSGAMVEAPAPISVSAMPAGGEQGGH